MQGRCQGFWLVKKKKCRHVSERGSRVLSSGDRSFLSSSLPGTGFTDSRDTAKGQSHDQGAFSPVLRTVTKIGRYGGEPTQPSPWSSAKGHTAFFTRAQWVWELLVGEPHLFLSLTVCEAKMYQCKFTSSECRGLGGMLATFLPEGGARQGLKNWGGQGLPDKV